MRRLFVLLSFVAIVPGLGFVAQDSDDNAIAWSESRPLQWSDFLATAQENSEYMALTDYKITFKGTINPNNYGKKGPKMQEITYEVTCVFNKQRSWVIRGKETDELLRHEQAHFDLAEIYARKLRKELKALKPGDPNAGKAASKLFSQVTKDCLQEQQKYDRETKHSMVVEKQEEWEKYVEKELKKLGKYAYEEP